MALGKAKPLSFQRQTTCPAPGHDDMAGHPRVEVSEPVSAPALPTFRFRVSMRTPCKRPNTDGKAKVWT
eukprot:353600-Chlamydomonas_euryale.AAC.15